ncbi:MAG: dihydrodipicolinate synthase family protein [Alphaproteobacteria bacterium]|nr:dihydrodipicolinate synthase family protein [Alphaproteobacteria bacterium]
MISTDTIVSGLWTAVLTPLDSSLKCDHARLAAHCRDLMARGVDGVAVFGTTGEGTSFTVAERIAAIDALRKAGIPAQQIVLGNGSPALGDAVELARYSVKMGLAGVLMLPPFFFKGVDDEGVYAAFAETIERVADDRLRVYLYNIPQISGVPVGVAAIERLLARYPAIVAGIKDSSADWDTTSALLQRFMRMTILVGAEEHVPRAMAAGGRGTICGMANIIPEAMRAVIDQAGTPQGDALLESVARLTKAILSVPFVPALKAVKASDKGDASWSRVRAPLRPLDGAKAASIVSAVAGFRAAAVEARAVSAA